MHAEAFLSTLLCVRLCMMAFSWISLTSDTVHRWDLCNSLNRLVHYPTDILVLCRCCIDLLDTMMATPIAPPPSCISRESCKLLISETKKKKMEQCIGRVRGRVNELWARIYAWREILLWKNIMLGCECVSLQRNVGENGDYLAIISMRFNSSDRMDGKIYIPI